LNAFSNTVSTQTSTISISIQGKEKFNFKSRSVLYCVISVLKHEVSLGLIFKTIRKHLESAEKKPP